MNFLNNRSLLIDTLQHLLIIIFVKKKVTEIQRC